MALSTVATSDLNTTLICVEHSIRYRIMFMKDAKLLPCYASYTYILL